MVAQQHSTASRGSEALGGGIKGFGVGALVGLAAVGLFGAIVGSAIFAAPVYGAVIALLAGAPIIGIAAGAFGLKGAFSGVAKTDSDEAKYQRQRELYAGIQQENLSMVAEQNQAIGAQTALAQAAPMIYQQATQDTVRKLVAMGPKRGEQSFAQSCGCKPTGANGHGTAEQDRQAQQGAMEFGAGGDFS